MENDKITIKGRYVLETDCVPKEATGINYNVQGDEVILNFFYDSPVVPTEFQLEMNNGVIEDHKDTNSEYVRSIHSRISIKRKDIVGLLKMVAESIEEMDDD